MELQKEQEVLVDLGYKFNHSLVKAIFKQIIDVFEDGTQMLYCVVPFEIVKSNCSYVDSTLNSQMGVEKLQIIEILGGEN